MWSTFLWKDKNASVSKASKLYRCFLKITFLSQESQDQHENFLYLWKGRKEQEFLFFNKHDPTKRGWISDMGC